MTGPCAWTKATRTPRKRPRPGGLWAKDIPYTQTWPHSALSGGEAQRIKLSGELARTATGGTVYILDEPTTGLHFDDIVKLLKVLDRLVEAGNTVIIIEHNLDVIASADWVIDLGPDGGEAGGRIVAAGSPQEVANVSDSVTGQYLKTYFKKD